MSLSLKIDLENKIFYRAAALQTSVDARRGSLRSVCEDACLQELLRVYNRFFSSENEQGIDKTAGAEAVADAAARAAFWRDYEYTHPFLGGIKNGWELPPVAARRGVTPGTV